MDNHYPVRSTFSLLNQLLDEYQKNFGDSWKTAQVDKTQLWPYLSEALTKFQDLAEADKLLNIQRELDETKIILHKTTDSVLAWGEKLDSLVEKSSDLSAASQMFYKQAKKTNQCCTRSSWTTPSTLASIP
jgi:synaptobrevin family protein YKT6